MQALKIRGFEAKKRAVRRQGRTRTAIGSPRKQVVGRAAYKALLLVKEWAGIIVTFFQKKSMNACKKIEPGRGRTRRLMKGGCVGGREAAPDVCLGIEAMGVNDSHVSWW